MNKLLVGFFSMSLVFLLSFVPATQNMAEAASQQSTKAKNSKLKKVAYKGGSKKKKRSKRKKKRRGGGCQTLSSATLHKKASRFENEIRSASKRYGVSTNLIKAVITIESCFRSKVRGGLGEYGLMQLMPKTARRLKVKNGLNVRQNINGGAKYLSFLLKRYKGNMTKAIAAYNAGEGRIDKGRIPNRRYVNKVLHAYRKFSYGKVPSVHIPKPSKDADLLPSSKRKKKTARKEKVDRKERKVAKRVVKQQRSTKRTKASRHYRVAEGDTVYEVMRQTGTSVRKIISLNGLKFPYHLSKGQKLVVSGNKKSSRSEKKASKRSRGYVVQQGDTVYNVMRQTGVPVEQIISANDLSAPYTLSVGQSLKLR